jgi:AraC-like DNA-binding protein
MAVHAENGLLLPAVPERYRVIIIEKGDGFLRLNGRMSPLSAPAILCLNERESFSWLGNEKAESRVLYFHPNVINHKFRLPLDHSSDEYSLTDSQDLWCLKPFNDRNESLSGFMAVDPIALGHALQIMDVIGGTIRSQSDSGWPCRSRSYLLELLFFIGRIYSPSEAILKPFMGSDIEYMEGVLVHLHSRYREKLKLEELAIQFHTNKTTLNARFKELTGYTVMAYLARIRIQTACSALRNTKHPIQEVMDMVGIHDSAHFLRYMRKFTGLSPSEYRNRYCWME